MYPLEGRGFVCAVVGLLIGGGGFRLGALDWKGSLFKKKVDDFLVFLYRFKALINKRIKNY